jgi:hypothetical protein
LRRFSLSLYCRRFRRKDDDGFRNRALHPFGFRAVAQSQARLEVLTERLERLEKAPAESPKRDGANKQEHPS